MNGFRQLYCDIAASLFHKPATYNELRSRDFLKTKSDYGIGRCIQELERRGWLYYRGSGEDETMHIYRRVAKHDYMIEYQLLA